MFCLWNVRLNYIFEPFAINPFAQAQSRHNPLKIEVKADVKQNNSKDQGPRIIS